MCSRRIPHFVAKRLKALQHFRDGQINYLMATDLASRGLDIKGIETVVNYDMPTQLAQYLHRVGRTARAGRKGRFVRISCMEFSDCLYQSEGQSLSWEKRTVRFSKRLSSGPLVRTRSGIGRYHRRSWQSGQKSWSR